MFGRVFASLSGLFVTGVAVFGIYGLVSEILVAMSTQADLTISEIIKNPNVLGGSLLLLSLLLLGLNLFFSNCVLIKKLCGKSCSSSDCSTKTE